MVDFEEKKPLKTFKTVKSIRGGRLTASPSRKEKNSKCGAKH